MNKREIAIELLCNTKSSNLADLIHRVISYLDGCYDGIPLRDDMVRFVHCLSYIESERFDIKGFGLISFPVYDSFRFGNIKNDDYFDLDVLYNGKVVPKYIDTAKNEIKVATIQISINNYYRLQVPMSS